jgi:hypothetical protein
VKEIFPFKNTTKDRYFQVFDQWIEILLTDQVVPVEVKYDPFTGRQVPVEEADSAGDGK